MNRDVYIKFFPDSWRADEQLGECSLAARGLWIELMALAHKYGGYVLINGRAPSLEALAKAVRAKVREVKALLLELLDQGVCSLRADGAYFSRRMVRDFERRARNRENGSKGGNPALSDKRDIDDPRITESDNQDPTTLYSLVVGSSSSPRSTLRKEQDPDSDSFARFWQRYPNRKAKAAAMKAWRHVAPNAELLTAIHAALDWQIKQPGWLKDRGQFVPMASTYLNGRRWEDEPQQRIAATVEIRDWQAECQAHHAGRCPNPTLHDARMEAGWTPKTVAS